MDNSKIRTIDKKKLHKDILKVIIATAVFYVGLFCFPKKVDLEINYLQEHTELPQAVNTGIHKKVIDALQVQTGAVKLSTISHHNSAKLALLQAISKRKQNIRKKFQFTCKESPVYCKIIDFHGVKKYEQQILYVKLTETIGNFMVKYQKFGKPILSVLKKIDILNKKGSPRAYASWSKITMHGQSIKNYKEYFNLVGHEIGHVMDLGAIHGVAKEKHKFFTEFGNENFEIDDPSLSYYAISWVDEQTRKETMDQQHFCSRYGMSNPFEDFAECHNLYLNHNNMFVFMAKRNEALKAKYNFMANLYGGKYLFDDKNYITMLSMKPERRAWDTTKLYK